MNFFIVAVDEKGGIAKDHKIPWHFKEDFKFFKEKTQRALCVLGYNTYNEIATMRGYPDKTDTLLPNRRCHVITSRDIPTNEWVSAHTSLNEDTRFTYSEGSLAYIGGVSIYNYAMSDNMDNCELADYGYITRIKKDYDCDKFFNNELLEENFKLIEIIAETEDLRFELWERKTV